MFCLSLRNLTHNRNSVSYTHLHRLFLLKSIRFPQIKPFQDNIFSVNIPDGTLLWEEKGFENPPCTELDSFNEVVETVEAPHFALRDNLKYKWRAIGLIARRKPKQKNQETNPFNPSGYQNTPARAQPAFPYPPTRSSGRTTSRSGR